MKLEGDEEVGQGRRVIRRLGTGGVRFNHCTCKFGANCERFTARRVADAWQTCGRRVADVVKRVADVAAV